MSDEKTRKWTVFFLLRSGDSLIDSLELINELRKIDFREEISIILCVNTLIGAIPALLTGDADLINNSIDRTETTIFYSLEKDIEISAKFLNSLKFIAQKDDFHLDDPNDIGNFFTINVVNKYSALRYMLFTWDHGNGYGIFRRSLENDRIVNSVFSLLPKPDESKKNTTLTMDELAQAISWAFDNKKMELLVMMNCNMQTIDAGYALRNSVNYLVAPETNIDLAGYNYLYFFRRFAENPDLPSRELAQCLINSFDTKIYPFSNDGIIARSATALFANDLSYYSDLAECIDHLGRAIEAALPLLQPEIEMARAVTFLTNEGANTVDLFQLLINLRKTMGCKWQSTLIDKIFKLQDEMIVGKYIGSSYASNIEGPKPSGLSIFFPIALNGETINEETLQIFMTDSFTKDKMWNKFALRFVRQPIS